MLNRIRTVTIVAALVWSLAACERVDSLFGSDSPSDTGGEATSEEATSGEATSGEAAPAEADPQAAALAPAPATPAEAAASDAVLVAAMYRGAGLSEGDLAQAILAFRRAATAATAEPMVWSNPETGRQGTITATRHGYDRDERPCREFRPSVAGGTDDLALVLACQDAQGVWQLRPN